jgi:16S rRNA G966 N2-methylase RsmD
MFDGGFEGLNVLDAFAGSGALGIEALSRGAAHCTFCERDRRALRVLQENIAGLGINDAPGDGAGARTGGAASNASTGAASAENTAADQAGTTAAAQQTTTAAAQQTATNVATVLPIDALSAGVAELVRGTAVYDLVALDPPYAMPQGSIKGLLASLGRAAKLAGGTVISYEHALDAPDELDGFKLSAACAPLAMYLISQKIYGKVGIRYFVCR